MFFSLRLNALDLRHAGDQGLGADHSRDLSHLVVDKLADHLGIGRDQVTGQHDFDEHVRISVDGVDLPHLFELVELFDDAIFPLS